VGIDVDRVACENAASNARRNALAPAWVCGSLDGIASQARFEVAVANLLWSRLCPWLPRLAEHAERCLVLSGYLRAERSSVARALRDLGLEMLEERQESQSGDIWCAARVAQPPAR
jgi:ribosomal protein L11 methylase PrmA